MTAEIDPVMRRLQPRQRRNLDRGVADDPEQLLVVPHVGFERGDVEIADDQRRFVKRLGPARHPLYEGQFLREFGVERGIGHVAAGRNIDILEADAVGQARADVPRLAIVLPVVAAMRMQRQPAQDRDAVMHALPGEQAVDIAEPLERLVGKGRVVDLGLLQAQHVGRDLRQEIADNVDTRANRIDVPGGDLGDGHPRRCSPSPPAPPVEPMRPVRTWKGLRSGGMERRPT